jgi:type I restriction enzyme S subunit
MFTSQLEASAVPLVPLEEAEHLVGLLDARLSVLQTLAANVEREGDRLQAFERSLLAKAFRGKLVPQDPNDEPADAMLARLRGANGAAKPPPKRR